MRGILIAIAVSATCSLAAASSFCVSGTLQAGSTPQPLVTHEIASDAIAFVQVPAPGTVALAVGGLIVLGRRRRER
ncbi:MAG: hypothetical protein ACREJD_04345 [Phycisphaerales bacterium]